MKVGDKVRLKMSSVLYRTIGKKVLTIEKPYWRPFVGDRHAWCFKHDGIMRWEYEENLELCSE